MPNEELQGVCVRRQSVSQKRPTIIHSPFVLHHFCAMHSSSASRIACFSDAMFFPMNTNSVSRALNGSKSQRPATKLKSCAPSANRTKPFARTTFAGRLFAKRAKQSREKIFSDLKANDSNSG